MCPLLAYFKHRPYSNFPSISKFSVIHTEQRERVLTGCGEGQQGEQAGQHELHFFSTARGDKPLLQAIYTPSEGQRAFREHGGGAQLWQLL